MVRLDIKTVKFWHERRFVPKFDFVSTEEKENVKVPKCKTTLPRSDIFWTEIGHFDYRVLNNK